jgi:hypothetical protein
MRKANEAVLAGKIPFIARERCWPAGVPAVDIYNRGQPVHFIQTPKMVVIINEAVWQRLSENHKTILIDAARKAERDLRDQISEIEADSYRFAREKGMKIYELTPDQVAEWRACSSGVLDSYMRTPGDQIRQILAAYGRLRTDPCCSVGPGGSFTGR